MPEKDLDVQFSLIAGWLGIVIGFYFNQQVADFIQRKYKESERSEAWLQKKSRESMDNYQETHNEIVEKYKEEMKNKRKSR
jgi:hypothetical protein